MGVLVNIGSEDVGGHSFIYRALPWQEASRETALDFTNEMQRPCSGAMTLNINKRAQRDGRHFLPILPTLGTQVIQLEAVPTARNQAV